MRRAVAMGAAVAVALVLLVTGGAQATAPGAPAQGVSTMLGYVTNPTAVVGLPDFSTFYVADNAGVEKWVLGTTGTVIDPDMSVDGLALSSDGLLYEADASASRVSVLDTATDEVVRRLPMAGKAMSPVAVVVSPDGSTIYLASTRTQAVSVVNAATGRIEQTIAAPPGLRAPSALTLSPDGSRLFVSDGQGTIWSADTTTLATSVTISGIDDLKSIAVSNDGETLYAAIAGATPAVDTIDVARGTVVYSAPLSGAPTGMTLLQDHWVIVTDPAHRTIDGLMYPSAPLASVVDTQDAGVVGYTDRVFIRPLPAGSTAAFQWYADGKPVPGATSSTIRLTADEIGAVMSLGVTTHGVGEAEVPGPDFFTDMRPVLGSMYPSAPSVSGRAVVGHTVKARVGSWGRHTKVRFSYQWYAGSKPIRGATRASLRVKKASQGKKLRLQVTGMEYSTKREVFSAYTKKVKGHK